MNIIAFGYLAMAILSAVVFTVILLRDLVNNGDGIEDVVLAPLFLMVGIMAGAFWPVTIPVGLALR